MIIFSTKKILIVPNFGLPADDEAMVTLKETIDAEWNFNAKIVDLQQMVIDEHPGEEIRDSKVIELAAHKLEELANDKSIVWDKPYEGLDNLLSGFGFDNDVDDIGFKEDDGLKRCEDEAAIHEEPEPKESNKVPFGKLPLSGEDAGIAKEIKQKVFSRKLPIRITVTKREELNADEPDLLVVFSESVMLAGGVKDKPILFINPAYNSEWPWKKQYYADRDVASDYITRYFGKMNELEDSQVLWEGSEVRRRPKPTLRYGIFTYGEDNYYSEFRDRYFNLAMIDESLRDPKQLAKTIIEFAEGDMEFPLLDIYRMVKKGFWPSKCSEICRFEEPVNLGQVTVLGLERGVPMADAQSGIKLRIAELSYTLPLEALPYHRELTMLRDAVAKEFAKLPASRISCQTLFDPSEIDNYADGG